MVYFGQYLKDYLEYNKVSQTEFALRLGVTQKHINEILNAFEVAKNIKNRPTCIIAKTIKGKGVSFMENNASWHGKAPSEEEYKKAIEELSK